MNLVFGSGLLGGLFIPLGDGNTRPPAPAVVQVRMLFLQVGMDHAQTRRVLGIDKHRFATASGNLRYSLWRYDLDDKWSLFLYLHVHYDHGKTKDLLQKAVLWRGRRLIAQVPDKAPRMSREQRARIDAAIRAIEERTKEQSRPSNAAPPLRKRPNMP